MREIKFRAFDTDLKKMFYIFRITSAGEIILPSGFTPIGKTAKTIIPMQYIGLKDKNGKDCYIGDICRFDNGDTFYFDNEDWLEIFPNWIGEPECSDQMRDLYRVGNAEVIGNIYENPELLEAK